METITNFATAIGLIVAAIALILNFFQFRRIEMSIKGNTYQQLAQFALELKRILIENPEISYVYTQNNNELRKQEIFDNLIGNYLEDIWLQRKYGLIDEEMWLAYDGLTRELIANHPNVAKLMGESNYVGSLREYIRSVSLEVEQQSLKEESAQPKQ